MKRETSAERTRREIMRLCHNTLDSRTLRVEVLKRLQTVIPFDFSFFSTWGAQRTNAGRAAPQPTLPGDPDTTGLGR